MLALMPFSRACFAIDTPGSQAAAASRRRNSGSWFGRPLRLPGLASESVAVVSIESDMLGTTLMSLRIGVYDGRREVLAYVGRYRELEKARV